MGATKRRRPESIRGLRFGMGGYDGAFGEAIVSPALQAERLGAIVRSHRAIENSPHRVMDMVFRDDECRLRTEHAPADFTTIAHMARNPIRRAPGKAPLRLRRKAATWDADFPGRLNPPCALNPNPPRRKDYVEGKRIE